MKIIEIDIPVIEMIIIDPVDLVLIVWVVVEMDHVTHVAVIERINLAAVVVPILMVNGIEHHLGRVITRIAKRK